MYFNASRLMSIAALMLTATGAIAHAQTTPTCNGLRATIVATTSGQIMGTAGDDVIVGTPGDDQIFGMGGNDTICGGGGNDQITGGQGNDTLFGNNGNDTFFWNPGDGSDRIEGEGGSDTLRVAGANIGESFGLSANGTRLRLSRDIASVVLDAADVEQVEFTTRGGTDLVTVGTLTGVGVQRIAIDLEGVQNSHTPDGQPDSIIVFGTEGNDRISVTGGNGVVNVTGAGPAIEIRNSEVNLDTLSIYGLNGNDQIDAHDLAAGALKLIVDGGPGNDTITDSQGADSLVGGEGDDTFVWAVGSPVDLIGGEAGNDTLRIVGSTAADFVTISAGQVETQVVNSADNSTMLTDVDEIVLQAKGGADQFVVNASAAAFLKKITYDLRPGSDNSARTIVVNGTAAAEVISITGGAGSLTVSGLAPMVVVEGSRKSRDTLTVNGGPGDDVLNAQGLAADTIQLALNGGSGQDTVTGSAGDDLISWVPGDGSDVIEGGDGVDTLQVNGSNIAERVSFTASGSHLRFTRDIAAITLDVNAVERVNFAAVGGADTISLGDLGGTAVKRVALNLAGSSTDGDGQNDTILIAAQTINPIATSLGAGTMSISWSGVTFAVTGVEPGKDTLILQTTTGPAPVLTTAIDNSVAETGIATARR